MPSHQSHDTKWSGRTQEATGNALPTSALTWRRQWKNSRKACCIPALAAPCAFLCIKKAAYASRFAMKTKKKQRRSSDVMDRRDIQRICGSQGYATEIVDYQCA